MTTILFATVLPWLLIAVGTWLAYQLARQNGRILLRLESIEERLVRSSAAPGGGAGRAAELPIGSAAPDFELPDLAGVRRKLSEFRGKDVLLIFFNPQCGFCTQMAADLAALPTEGGDARAVPVVVTSGDADENRKLVERYGIRCLVLLQEQMEVASKFGAAGTPMGYRLDGQGRIASELVVGAEALLDLAAGAASAAAGPQRNGAALGESGKQRGKGNRPLSSSRLNRSGLTAGTQAPDFRLPRLDGGELSLAELRGRPVLLVFSDPHCGPCDELAPHLERIHRQRSDFQVLMVGRKEVEANRAKAAQLGLTFPVVLQREWEISLRYGMFATPIGYAIDERGMVTKDVAVGLEPILALVAELARRTESHAASQDLAREEVSASGP